VFHISSIQAEDASREFPYSSQTMKNATGANQTQVSVKFNTEQVVFDAPPTLEVSYSNATHCVIILKPFDYKDCITAATTAFSEAMYDDACRRLKVGSFYMQSSIVRARLYAHSVHGRADEELDEEEYNRMRMQGPAVIYLEAKYAFQ